MKPLGYKAYGSIPHLPGSRLGDGDHHCHEGQAKIATLKARDKYDVIIVQEKLDGSCCSVAKINGQIVALGRAGYLATSSEFSVHHSFALYVEMNARRFSELLAEGERAVGEYLAQAIGTRYNLPHEPFVVFDIMRGTKRAIVNEVCSRTMPLDFIAPRIISTGKVLPIETAMALVEPSGHGAIDPVEGVIYRVERKGEVDFLTKFVRHDKEDGKYFPENNNGIITWNDERYKVELPTLVQSVAKSKQEIAEGKCKEYTAAELIDHRNS